MFSQSVTVIISLVMVYATGCGISATSLGTLKHRLESDDHSAYQLIALDASNIQLKPSDMERIGGMSGLQTLVLINTGISASDLAPLARLNDLTSLDLSYNPDIGDDAVVNIATIPKLEVVNLRATSVTTQGTKSLAALRPDLFTDW